MDVPPHLFVKIIHVVGAFCLFLGFGGLLALGQSRAVDKIVASLHGAGLLLLFLTGFAIQGMGPHIIGFPVWLILKIVLWLVMVGLFVFVKKKKISAKAGIWGSLAVGAVVAFLCIVGPLIMT